MINVYILLILVSYVYHILTTKAVLGVALSINWFVACDK